MLSMAGATKRIIVLSGLAGLLAGSAAGVACAQNYPSRPVRFVVAYVPGGPTDIFARGVAQKLTEQMGQPVMVDNRPGANGVIAADLVMKAPADGYTFWVADTGHLAINPATMRKPPYDAVKDFVPVTLMMRQDFYLVVPAALPAQNVKELVALSKSRPSGLSYGTVGTGSVHHLGLERIRQLTGANLLHVPYKGGAQLRGPLVTGEIDMAVGGITVFMEPLKAKHVRPLAIAAPSRSARMPDVPTLAEAGVPGIDIHIGVGLVAPAGTPRRIVERMRNEIVKAMADPELQQRNNSLGFEPVVNTPAEYEDKIRADLLHYRNIASEAKIEAH